MESMTIGKLAKRAGVGVETIRFYERKGLLPEPPRRYSGYREYPESAIDRVRFIRRAKELGFTLKEIGELLELRIRPGTTCRQISDQATAKIADIEEKIRSLEAMRSALEKLAADCPASGPTSECPILAHMSHQLPAAAGDAPHSPSFSHLGVLDVPSSTPPRPSDRKRH